MMQLMNNKVKR